MDLTTQVIESMSAAISGMWIRSFEHTDAVQEVIKGCEELAKTTDSHEYFVLQWDADLGLHIPDGVEIPNFDPKLADNLKDPMAALLLLRQLNAGKPDTLSGMYEKTYVLTLKNLHMFLCGADGRISDSALCQVLQNTVEAGASRGLFVVALSCDGIALPLELEKTFRVLDHQLPGPADLHKLLTLEFAVDIPDLDCDEGKAIVGAAAGLTRTEARHAFGIAMARPPGIVEPNILHELKAEAIKKIGALEMLKTDRTIDDPEENAIVNGFQGLGGLMHVKDYSLRTLRAKVTHKKLRAKGLVLLGVPGTGKSELAKRLGFEVDRPTFRLDVGALMGSLIGQTEEMTRRCLKVIDQTAPSILFVDEVEKALSGTTGGANDSGVGARLFGSLLTWQQEHTSDVFLIVTCNDITKLPPEFTRAGRFDAIFFMDLPVAEQRKAIWQIYFDMFDIDGDQERPNDSTWTGAEIEKCCAEAARLQEPLIQAATRVVPVATTYQEKIAALRTWAHQRCLSADYVGVYDKEHYQDRGSEAAKLTNPARKRRVRTSASRA